MEASTPTAGKRVPRDLPVALTCANKAFEKVRYVYEGDSADVTFVLSDVPTLLRRVILEKRPEWRNVRRRVEEGTPTRKAG